MTQRSRPNAKGHTEWRTRRSWDGVPYHSSRVTALRYGPGCSTATNPQNVHYLNENCFSVPNPITFDSTMLWREDLLFGCSGSKPSQSTVPTGLALASNLSEIEARLKCDHARGAVAAEAHAEQSGRRRSGIGKRAEPGLRRWFSRDTGQHHGRKRKIRMVE